ncbi:MAG: sugar phosphate isomerase/epimerase [Lentisphaerae bacterium]|jgi:L-ribulose-5-phosphate 3-epimerase|nr:sugar phosphate isomerase/epimerase [Lentisphaerota bacterium]MBT4815310.1 sugar phosphate isomerase/epimerase [Lentisphaerota bacterium]MBT5608160.1 sugar phosphate isomerase/epimerase [Lentisphaerota bacterium]MBT7058708.1 sugar phosphate isomerase/epimerase [Lentisphaerota bacterium]MBT7847662.1 sugar phosphate isomerase/epimerase [Lentisphaerota bacterium]
MKISVGNQMIATAGTALERFELAKQAGLDGVEIWLGTADANMESSDDDIRQLADTIGEAGLACSSVASTLGWQNPITSLDDSVFEQALTGGRRQIEVARLLGTDGILIVTGRVLPEAPYRQAWDRMVSGFRSLCAFAAEHGVRIGAETCPKLSKNLMTPGECLTFIEAVDHPAIGIYLDTANVTYSGYAQDFIHDLGDRIVRIHVKDFTAPDEKGAYRGTWPGNGTVGWEAIAEACKDTGYNGWAVLEFSPVEGEEKGLDLLKTARNSTDSIFNG